MPEFSFRMRAYAAAHFPFEEVLFATFPDAQAFLQSEYVQGADGPLYPVTIHGEIRGHAGSIDEAERKLSNLIGHTLPVLALSGNAAVEPPLVVSVHGLDLNEPQPFWGYKTPGPHDWFPPGGRKLDTDSSRALMLAIGQHPHNDLLFRAVESYRQALSYWTPEKQLLAGEFLHIAAETLARFLVERDASARGMSRKNLARLLGVEPKVLLQQRMRDVVFACDLPAYEAMVEASNGFEHGYMSIDAVRGLMEQVLERSMRLVRQALIRASGVDASVESVLLAPRFDEPRGLVPVLVVARGTLAREDQSQPAPVMDGAPVELEWTTQPTLIDRRPDGEVNLRFQWQATATRLPTNARLTLSEYGVRFAHLKPAEPEEHGPSSHGGNPSPGS